MVANPPKARAGPVTLVFIPYCYILGIYKCVDISYALVVDSTMIKLIVGFIMGAIAMFLVMGILLIIQDERRIKELKHKARER